MRTAFFAIALLLYIQVVGCVGVARNTPASREAEQTQVETSSPASPDSADLLMLYEQDQADRTGNPTDGVTMYQRDVQRRVSVRKLLDEGAVRTGADYYHAALVFQHADDVEGIQLAHELAIIAAVLGNREARWLAAASYDRLMMDLGRYQRFGTQFQSANGEMMHLVPIDRPGVTDAMRAALDCPTLKEAQQR
ncbi:MAG: hypothetical protein HBSAPP02_28830 [Phycisphaerae bacterium]|nr:MAG: hypothetical protein HRU71_05080 [Planctomycetia bacterium]GJQ27851.1 MAG: hypothetical protein HBSAPP02_28830 [Phycisphaerae bacterium]